MMTSQHPIGQNYACIHISHSMAFRILNKIWGYPGFLRSYNGLKKGMFLPIFALYWAFLNFDARARACRDAHGDKDCQCVDLSSEVYVYKIWAIYEVWLWRYSW